MERSRERGIIMPLESECQGRYLRGNRNPSNRIARAGIVTTSVPPSREADVAEQPGATAGSELRTFLFADVRGYTRFTQERGDEAAAQLVAKFAGLMRDGVRARGGQVLELRGDEVLAVFGSARQALRAAVDLQARFILASQQDPSLPLYVGIGIDAGEAVALEGGYRGEALNLAARLCNLAGPGEVLATEGVVYLGRSVPGISYAERALVPVKGFADPVRVIRVIGSSETNAQAVGYDAATALEERRGTELVLPIGGFLGALPSGELIGRDQEWNTVMASLELVMQGTGQLVTLSGEPGTGKTRIAQEVTLKARHWGFLVATGRCYESEQAVPYHPFLEALVTLFDACSPSVRAEIPRRWAHLARLLPDQLGILPVPTNGQEDQYLLFRAVTGFIDAISEETPVALLLDDLHLADDSSLKLLQHLVRHSRGNRVFLLGTYRDVEIHRQHPLEAALLDLSREGLLLEVEVRRLDQESTSALVTELIGDRDELKDLAALVYRRTDGNAFFVQEMLHAPVERGDLYREDGHWAGRAIQEMAVPKSIRSVIGQRVSRLEEQAQEILRAASVLGHEFEFDDLLALGAESMSSRRDAADAERVGWSEDEVEGALEQSIIAGLVRDSRRDKYAFNHALTQQALYAELSTRRRKRLHLAAGRALERLPEGERQRRAGELAWHFLEADDAEPALVYSMLAGDRAEAVFANREADQRYRTALELAREIGDVSREIESLEKLGGVLTIGARYGEALTMLEEAVQLHQRKGDREGEACAVAQMGNIHFLQDTAEEGILRLHPLAEELERSSRGESTRGLAALWAALAWLYHDTDRYDLQLKAAERAIELAPATGDESLRLGAEVSRSFALWRLNQNDETLSLMEELIPRAEAAGDLTNLTRALSATSAVYARRGEFEKDRIYQERMLQVAERRGDRGTIVLGSMALMTNAFLVGDWAQARTDLERAESVIRALGTTRLAIWPVTARAWISLREGNFDAAREYAEEAITLLHSAIDPTWQRNTRRLLAECDVRQGLLDAALARLEPYLDTPGARKDIGFLWTMAWIYLETDKPDIAADLAAQASARARKQNRRLDLVDALVMQGMVSGRQERWPEADEFLTEAAGLAHAITFPFGEGRARYERGQTLVRRGEAETARAELHSALAIFDRLGARDDAGKAEQAIAALPE